MGIVYVECCEKKYCCCCDDKRNKCPNPVRWNEGAGCEGLRQALADEGEVTFGGLTFRFFNLTTKYSSSFCPGINSSYRTPTLAQLRTIARGLTSDGTLLGDPLCPMVVWALNGTEPVLAEVIPSTGTVNELRTPSLRCKAYRICVSTLLPNG